MNNQLEDIHWTHLKQMGLSPAHYMAAVRGDLQKKIWLAGRLLHFLVLGGVEGVDYVVWNGRRQGNAWKDFQAEHTAAGLEIFTRTEVDRETAVAEAVKKHPIAAPLLVGEHEVGIIWEQMGRRCSSRLDVLNVKERRAVDLKRAVTSRPERFQRSAIHYGYHAQGAFYQDACEYAKTPIDTFYDIAVEPFPPYAVTVFRFTDRALLQGRKMNRLWREQLDQCQAQGYWPEYTQSIVTLDWEEEPELIFAEPDDEPVAEEDAAE